jgi:hypothetical protein
MKKTLNSVIGMFIISICATPDLAKAQSFVNLNFESASVPPSGPEPYPNSVSIVSALPGWSAYLGTQQITQVGYNDPPNSTASVTLIGPTWNSADTGASLGVGIIDGNYSVDLQTGANPLNGTPQTINASIEQYGMVPGTAESLLFAAAETTPLSVSFNGNILSPVALSSGMFSANGVYYTLYAANISPWAGQKGELEFTADFNGSFNYVVLDDISFSPNAVPEPSIVALTAMGGLLLGVRKWLARRC